LERLRSFAFDVRDEYGGGEEEGPVDGQDDGEGTVDGRDLRSLFARWGEVGVQVQYSL